MIITKMKKTFNTPYIKIVEVKNDIIATSFGSTNESVGYGGEGSGKGFAPRRGSNIWSDGESVEDLDF